MSLVCALWLACTPRTVASPTPGKSPPTAPADKLQGWRLVRVPRASHWTNFADGTSPATRVLFSGSRAEVRAGAVTFAHDDTLQAILRSCPSDGGFLHFTEGGGLFWSGEFLGRLGSVGVARSDLYQRVVQCNPVLALSSSGRPTLHVSRSGSRLLGQSDLALAHFQTTERVRAVAPPDRLLESRDGGRTFVTLSARPSADLDEPTAWLGSDIDVLDQAGEPRQSYAVFEDRFRGANLVRAAWARRAVATEAGKVAGGLVLSDGTWVRQVLADGGWKMLLAFRTSDGRVTNHSIDQSPADSCTLQPYGRRVLHTCSQLSPKLIVVGPEGKGSLPDPPHLVRAVTADPKGRWIAALAEASQPPPSARKPMLVLFDGAGWREYPGLDVTPLAATSSWLLVKRNVPGSLALLSLAAPEREAHDFGEGVDENAVSLLEHKLAYVRYTQGKRTLIWRDSKSGNEGPTHEIPAQIYRIGFADEQHGMAVDSDGGLRVTEDGGRSFTAVPWQGTKPDPRAELRCWSRGCSFAAAIAFTDEPLTREPPALSDPEVELPEAMAESQYPYDDVFPRVPVPENSPGTDMHYRCSATPPLLRIDPPDPTNPSNQPDLCKIPTLGLVEREGGALTWSSRDAQGAFRVETPVLTDLAAQLTHGQLAGPGVVPQYLMFGAVLQPVLVARSYAIFVQMRDPPDEIMSERAGDTFFFVLEASGRARVLAKTPPAEGTQARLLRARVQAFPLAKGGAAVLVSAPGRQELFELDATGTVVGRRWFVGPGGRMALGPDGLSFVVEDGDSTRVYSMARGSPGRDVTWDTSGAFPDCTRASQAGSPRDTYLVASNLPSIEIGSRPEDYHLVLPWAGASLLEIGPAGGCWRSVLVSEPFPIELRATGATMRGAVFRPERAHALVCRRAEL